VKIVGFQLEIPHTKSVEDIYSQLKIMERKIDENQGADLYFFPELNLYGYSKDQFDLMKSIIEKSRIEETTHFNFVSDLAKKHKVAIGYSVPTYDFDTDNYWISFVVVDDKGQLLTLYNKLHLCQYGNGIEKDYFVEGRSLGVFEFKGIKFGTIICYDQRFPELCRRLVDDLGSDVILHPVAFSKDNSYPSWHSFAITRALENQVYFLSLNFSGEDFGGSIFVPPWIDYDKHPIVKGDEETKLEITIDLDKIIESRVDYTFKKDRLNYKNLK
jgi:predicted amidohydrolase